MKPVQMSAFRRTPKASERLARQLATSIVEGEIEEGARLPHESEMLAQLQVSRATLREALRLLEVWGLVVIRTGPGGGPTVRRPSSGEFAEHLALMLQFQDLTLQDVSDARLALEPMMARLAAERITPKQIAELRDSIEIMKQSYDNSAEFWVQNQRFHSELAEAGDSRVIKMIVDSLKFIADGASSGVHYEHGELAEVIRAHTKIVDLLEAGDVEGAAKSMHHHLDAGRRFIAKNQPYALRSRIHWPD
ncbi:Pyruvate dehydrogenase complex repressor [Rhodococcus erythropolis]|uniref:FadR/GntR family transcriptional regulator n=1 Tax=Rhodococcus erythropolis TaxID=1833 RepID=UPI000BB39862|nr:FadR/GntR family transcriptional regulator [Rhodococcus erythropolis]PBI89429.1 Pyruvate dehydrogenase complex repressor [Rhodococcus erythropolis]